MLFNILGGAFGLFGFVSFILIFMNKDSARKTWIWLFIDNAMISLSFFALRYYPAYTRFILPVLVSAFVVWIFLEKKRKTL
jgi:hypothetical protein